MPVWMEHSEQCRAVEVSRQGPDQVKPCSLNFILDSVEGHLKILSSRVI